MGSTCDPRHQLPRIQMFERSVGRLCALQGWCILRDRHLLKRLNSSGFDNQICVEDWMSQSPWSKGQNDPNGVGLLRFCNVQLTTDVCHVALHLSRLNEVTMSACS